jgi:hypothetical protein
MLLELYCLEVEEEFDLSSLRVQAPLTWARRPLALCLDACYFIKCLYPLDQHLGAYASRSALDPFMEERLARWLVEAERGWRHAGLLPLSTLLGPRCFWQSVHWRSFIVFASLVLR